MKKYYKYRAKGKKLDTNRTVWLSKEWRTMLKDAKLDVKFADKRMFKNFKIEKRFWKYASTKNMIGTKKQKKKAKKYMKKMVCNA